MSAAVTTAAVKLRSRTAKWVLITGLACALAVVALGAGRADAICRGTGCLPGSGYFGDRYWDCGLLNANTYCYMGNNNVGTTSSANALQAGWGWGSADYDGGGTDALCIEAASNTTNYFFDCADNLARACFNNNCDDQDSITNIKEWILNINDRHTIYGHGMY